MGVIVQTCKLIHEVHEVYDGNILNNFVPMLGLVWFGSVWFIYSSSQPHM